jgi:1-acyl-sn-glycerol-3-phosphate acyltransferase
MRSVWVALNLFVFTIALGSIVILASLARVRGGIYEWAGRTWARRLLRASGVRVRLEGLEHVPSDRPKVVASNHQSWYDVFAIAAFLPGRYHFVAKKELAGIPLFGAAWKACGHISIDRSDTASAIRSLEQAGAKMRKLGSTIVIFPEGTRSPTGQLLPFKKGAFMLAIHNGVDIVPTAVIGGRAILPKRGWRVRPGQLIVRFGAPIRTVDYSPEQRDQLIGRVRSEVERLLHAPLHPDTIQNVGDHQHLRT